MLFYYFSLFLLCLYARQRGGVSLSLPMCVCVCARACASGGDRIVIICGFLILKIDVVSPLPVAGTVASTTPTTTVTTVATSGENVYGCMGAWGYGCPQENLSNIYLRLRDLSEVTCIELTVHNHTDTGTWCWYDSAGSRVGVMSSVMCAAPLLTPTPSTHHSVLTEDSTGAQSCGRRVSPTIG